MFKIDYNRYHACLYAGDMLDKVDSSIADVLKPDFKIEKTLGKDNPIKVTVIVERNGFTKQFLADFRKSTNLRQLLQGDTSYLRAVIDRVRNNSSGHFESLTKKKYDRYYSGLACFDDFHTILKYIFVDKGYAVDGFVDGKKVVSNLKLKVCPYCGQTYIASVSYPRGNGELHVARAQIDHFFPKGQYPFLALSYANFIPSCPGCNISHKHIEDVIDKDGRLRMMSPYDFDESKFAFQFGLKSFEKLCDENVEVKTKFKDDTPEDRALEDGYQHILGIDKLYEYHNDIVVDILIKKAIELTSQYLYYKEGVHINPAFLNRYVTATYGYEPDPKDDRNRIMSKFIRDIVRQVELMVGLRIGAVSSRLLLQ